MQRPGGPAGVPDELPVRAQLVAERPSGRTNWSENRWFVLAMLLLVMGPVALPMLWRSRQFPLLWKLLLTVLMLAVTAALLGLIWYIYYQAFAPLRDLEQFGLK